jgi:hypothetical protein
MSAEPDRAHEKKKVNLQYVLMSQNLQGPWLTQATVTPLAQRNEK